MSWEKCFVDPCKGVAFFDGVEIIADSITDPRWDRVLPILEEEQVFMCRAMKHLLKPGMLVLDVGTGSGVFAIWAAIWGCRVVAIDISPRAIRTAQENVRRNGVGAVNSIADLLQHKAAEGAVYLAQARLDQSFLVSDLALEYDVVILAPPYNPSMPDVSPALHASGGPLGQEPFEDQLPLAVKLVRSHGTLVGNHMSLCQHGSDSADSIEAVTRICTEFGRGAVVRYQRLLPNDIQVDEFLRKQYHSFLTDELWRERTEDYIESQRAQNPNRGFCLIYFEASRSSARSEATLIEESSLSPPSVSWKQRTWLHRQIVDHTASCNSFPAPALFMEVGPECRLVKLNAPSPSNEKNRVGRPFAESPMQQIDKYVRRRQLLAEAIDEPSPTFDLIAIDSAPWFGRSESDESSNIEELKLWLRARPDRTKIAKKALEEWQENTAEQQRADLSLFLHPHFVGRSAPELWSEISFPTVSTNVRGSMQDLFDEADQIMWTRMQDRRRVARRSMHEHAAMSDSERGAILLDEDNGFSSTRLAALSVPRNAQQLESMVEGDLMAAGLLIDESCDRQGLFAHHHHLMHLDMLTQLHEKLPRILGDSEEGWSALAGLPLRLAYSDEYGDLQGDPYLSEYRGGIWLYAHSSEQWTKRHEEALHDLLRFAWLVLESYYNAQALHAVSEYQKNLAVAQYVRGASHSLKNAIIAAQEPFQDVSLVYQKLFGANSKIAQGIEIACKDTDTFLELKSYLLSGVFQSSSMEFLARQAQTMFWIMDARKMRDALLQQKDSSRRTVEAHQLAMLVKLALVAGISKSTGSVMDDSGSCREDMYRIVSCEMNSFTTVEEFCESLNKALAGRFAFCWSHEAAQLWEIDIAVVENVLFELLVNAAARAGMVDGDAFVALHIGSTEGRSIVSVRNSARSLDVQRLKLELASSELDFRSRSTGVTGLHQVRLLPSKAAEAKRLDKSLRPEGARDTGANSSTIELSWKTGAADGQEAVNAEIVILEVFP